MANLKIADIRKELDKVKTRGAWSKGLVTYAHMILDKASDEGNKTTIDTSKLHAELLPLTPWHKDSFDDWAEASRGGTYLIYNGDIAETLSSPSELKKTKNGQLDPNSREDWIDVQTRALYQAENLIKNITDKMQSAVNVPKTTKTKLPTNAQLSNRAFKQL